MELFRLYGEIAVNGDNAVRQLRGIDQVGQRTGGVLRSLAMQAVGVAAGFGLWTSISAAVNGLKNLGQQAIMLNANLEQSKVAFATFLKSVRGGNAFIEEMRRFAAKTPFQYTELEQYAKRLLAFKFEAKEILPMMTAIGNAASGLGGGAEIIGRITMALGQMKVKGRVMSEEMLQLTEAGIGAWDILAKGIGKSTAEVQKMVQQGLVPADEAIKILTAGMNEQFDNMMDKQSRTMMGFWSTIKDVGEMVLTDVGHGVFEELKKSVSGVAGSLERLQSSGQLRQWAQGLGESLGQLAAILGTVTKLGAGALTAFLAWKAITGIPAGIAMVTNSMVALRGSMVATMAVGQNLWTAMKIAAGGQEAALAFVTAGRAVNGLAASERAAAAASVTLAEAQQAVKAALVSTGIGVLVVALGALVTYLMMAKNANEKFIESMEKEIKARDGKRTQLEAEMTQREAEIKQLEELKGKYAETDKALRNAKKGSEEATMAKAKLTQMTQELIPLIGEEGAEHIRSANDSVKAFDTELKAKASQVTQIKGKIEEAVRADAEHTIKKIQATQDRIKSLQNESRAYGIWANVVVWAYNQLSKLAGALSAVAKVTGHKGAASQLEFVSKGWDEAAVRRAAASREAEIDKLYDQLGNLTSRYRDLSSYSLDAGKAVESVGSSATSGMEKAGKAGKKAADEVGEFVKSLEPLHTKMDELDLKLEQQALFYRQNGDEAGAAAASLQTLNEKMDVQSEIISRLSDEYERMKAEKGEDAEETIKLRQELLREQQAQVSLQEKIIDANKAIEAQAQKLREHQKQVRESAEAVVTLARKYKQDMAAALEEYQRKVADTNAKLAADEKVAWEQYEQQAKNKIESIRDFMGLFEAVQPKEVTGGQLLENLRLQVQAMEEYSSGLATLEARGLDASLLAKLREMGPSAAAEIQALAAMSDTELAEYVSLWQAKGEEARQAATAQLDELRAETERKISELRSNAAAQLEQYRIAWETKNDEIRNSTVESLQKMVDSAAEKGAEFISALTAAILEHMPEFKAVLGELGVDQALAAPGTPQPDGDPVSQAEGQKEGVLTAVREQSSGVQALNRDTIIAVNQAWSDGGNTLRMTMTTIRDQTITTWQETHTSVQATLRKLVADMANSANQIKTSVVQANQTVVNSYESLGNRAYGWGTNLMSEFIRGLMDNLPRLEAALMDIATTASNYIGFHSPTKEGPGREADRWGPNLVRTFAEGIVATAPVLSNSMNILANVAVPQVNVAAAEGNVAYVTIYAADGSDAVDSFEREMARRGWKI